MSPYRLVGALALSVTLAPVALGQAEQRTIKGSIVAIYNSRVACASSPALETPLASKSPASDRTPQN